mmetsp:Transcript_727/g.1287  ORF Transcript_727/g.1287 Transcript_727/m.1287 type:complete len:628 (+) Transcript_727:35-1918(+)
MPRPSNDGYSSRLERRDALTTQLELCLDRSRREILLLVEECLAPLEQELLPAQGLLPSEKSRYFLTVTDREPSMTSVRIVEGKPESLEITDKLAVERNEMAAVPADSDVQMVSMTAGNGIEVGNSPRPSQQAGKASEDEDAEVTRVTTNTTATRWDLSDKDKEEAAREKAAPVPLRHAKTKQSVIFHLENALEANAGFQRLLTLCRLKCAALVRLSGFDQFFASLIFINSVVIGVEVEVMVSTESLHPLGVLEAIQFLFALSFMAELFIRAFGTYPFFLHNLTDWKWNAFDCVIVFFSVIEMALAYIITGGAEADQVLTMVRIIRIVRIARIIRVIRLLRQVRTMIYTLLNTLSALFWSVMLMSIVMYIFSIGFTQAVMEHILRYEEVHEVRPDYEEAMLKYWGSLLKTTYTLFQCFTGGVSWSQPAEYLRHLSGIYMLMFLGFLCFMVFAMMNVVTGFFCEHAFDMAQADKDQLVAEQLRQKDIFINHFRHLFELIDVDGSGDVSFAELQANIEDPQLQAYLAHLNISPTSAWQIFRLLDDDDSGHVTIEEFVEGLLTMKGSASAIDALTIIQDQQRQMKGLTTFMHFMETEMGTVQEKLNSLSGSKDSGNTPSSSQGKFQGIPGS